MRHFQLKRQTCRQVKQVDRPVDDFLDGASKNDLWIKMIYLVSHKAVIS